MNSKVSILSDISIYTTDGEGAVPLIDVFRKINQEFGEDTGLSKTSDADELKSFLKFILPNYDEDRVYVSDIKKVVQWYKHLHAIDATIFEDKGEEQEKDESKSEKSDQPSEKKTKPKPAKAKSSDDEKKSEE